MNKHATQGRLILAALKRRPLTYAAMLALGVGLSPWKRVKEAIRHDPEWTIVVTTRKRDGLVEWRAVRACKAK
jgi:hypothetical protein